MIEAIEADRPIAIGWVVVGGLMLAVLAEVSAGFLGLSWLSLMSPHLQFVLLVAGTVCIVYGLDGGGRISIRPISLRSYLPIVLITLLALLLRLWHNGDSIRVLVDELNFVSGMTNFWKPEHAIGLLTPMDNISPFTWLFPYWQSNFVAVFGRNMGAIRALSAVIGALTIPAMYLLARTLFNRRIALLGAFVLATFPPHIHYSRIALLSITDPLMGTLALGFLARGLQGGRRMDFALGGIFLGLTQYFFEGGRLLFPAVAVVWIIGMWVVTRRSKLDQSLQFKRLGISILAAVLVSIPVYITWIALDRPLVGRLDDSGLGASYWDTFGDSPIETIPRFVTDHLFPALSTYLFTPDQTPYYGGTTALVLPVLVPVFLLGIGFMLWRIQQPGMMLIGLWLLGASMGNSLLRTSGASTRYVVTFPAITLVIAIGLHETIQLIAPARYRNILIMGIGFMLGIGSVVYYFDTHLSAFDNQFSTSRPFPDVEDAVYRSLDFPAGTEVHMISRGQINRNFGANFLAFFRDDVKADGYISGELDAEVLGDLPNRVDQAFFLETEDVLTLSVLQTHYQSALEGPFFSPYNALPEKQLILFYVKANP